MRLGSDLLAARAQVQGEAELHGEGARLAIVEALIQAEVLETPRRGSVGISVWGRTMLLKEPSYAAPQAALDPG